MGGSTVSILAWRLQGLQTGAYHLVDMSGATEKNKFEIIMIIIYSD